MPAPLVIKIGGNDLERPGFVEALAQSIAETQVRQPCIVVHGGGRRVDDLLARLGIEPQYHNGQRVTDEAMLEIVEMVLSGQVNKRLTHALLSAQIDALGISGIDRGLLRVEPWPGNLGRVGRIVSVREGVLLEMIAQGVVPVISPVSAGSDGPYNVNADHAAGAIAAAVQASHAAFITNVPGVLVKEAVAPHLTIGEIHTLIENHTITGGMIPKVNAALSALNSGVPAVVITDLAGLCAGTGTRIVL